MTRFVLPAAPDHSSGGAVLPVYLGLYLVLLAFFVYFVAVNAAERRTEVAVADDVAAGIQPVPQVVATEPMPALRPLAEAFRPLALPGAPGEGEPDRLDAALSVDRIFVGGTATLRADFAPVLDRMARELTSAAFGAAAPTEGDPVAADETLDLQLLVGLPASGGPGGEPASVADLLAERLAVFRAAALARALLARGTSPETFAVGVAPGAGTAVRFLFRLDHHDAVRESHD